MAEWLRKWAINQKVAGSIPGRAKLHCVLAQSNSLDSGRMSLYLL